MCRKETRNNIGVQKYINKLYKQWNFHPIKPEFTLSDVEEYEGPLTEHMREYLTFIVTKSDFVKETEKEWPDLDILEKHLKNGENPSALYIYDCMAYEADLIHEHRHSGFERFSKTTPLYNILETFHSNTHEADTRLLEYIKLFVKYGVDIELGKTCVDFKILDHAVFHGYTQCVELLLKSGADPNKLDAFGRNSLYNLRFCPGSQRQPIYELLTQFAS
jgi:ankyrin repeat protein